MKIQDYQYLRFKKSQTLNYFKSLGYEFWKQDSEGLWYKHPVCGLVIYLSLV